MIGINDCTYRFSDRSLLTLDKTKDGVKIEASGGEAQEFADSHLKNIAGFADACTLVDSVSTAECIGCKRYSEDFAIGNRLALRSLVNLNTELHPNVVAMYEYNDSVGFFTVVGPFRISCPRPFFYMWEIEYKAGHYIPMGFGRCKDILTIIRSHFKAMPKGFFTPALPISEEGLKMAGKDVGMDFIGLGVGDIVEQFVQAPGGPEVIREGKVSYVSGPIGRQSVYVKFRGDDVGVLVMASSLRLKQID